MRSVLLLALVGTAVIAGCAGTSSNGAGARRVDIQLTEKGFEPAEIAVKAGQPVTLVVTRKTDNTCAKEIVVASMNVRRELPLNRPVEVTFTPDRAGEVRYACGMDMIGGKVIVR